MHAASVPTHVAFMFPSNLRPDPSSQHPHLAFWGFTHMGLVPHVPPMTLSYLLN